MSFARKLATQTYDNFKKFDHVIKNFNKLQRGDMVYKPELTYRKYVKCRLSKPSIEYIRNGNEISEHKFLKCDMLDDDMKSIGLTSRIQTNGLGAYGPCTLLMRPSYNNFKPMQMDASGLKIDDIIVMSEPFSTNGYIKLDEFVKRDHMVYYRSIYDGTDIESPGINYWLVYSYDTELNLLESSRQKLYPFPSDEQESNGVTFQVIQDSKNIA